MATYSDRGGGVGAILALALPVIQAAEGCRLRPYICPAGVPTIGWGSTRYLDGRAVTMRDPAIDRSTADNLLQAEARRALAEVARLVKVPMTPGQAAALCSFVYNLGAGRLRSSTLLRRFNAGDAQGAADQFPRWIFGNTPPEKLPGLIKRRAAERALFLQ